MVRPDRFERPTLWFEASNRRTFIDLALDTVVVQHCLFEVIAVDTWLVNDDRNMGNIVGSSVGDGRIEVFMIDFEKSRTLAQNPFTILPERPTSFERRLCSSAGRSPRWRLRADVDRFRSASISPNGRRGQSRNLRDFGHYLRDFGHALGRSHAETKPANCNSDTFGPDRELHEVPGCGTSDLA
jgi:hypothetical protein